MIRNWTAMRLAISVAISLMSKCIFFIFYSLMHILTLRFTAQLIHDIFGL